jgi:hypothetical protein
MDLSFGLRFGMVALASAGCAEGPRDEAVGSGEPRTATADPDSVIAMAPESLHVRLDLPNEVRVGQAVPIVIRLENGGNQPLDLYLRGRTIAFDIFVAREDGQIVWQRLKDEVIPAIIQLKVLRAGEVLELKDEWRQRGNRGEPVEPGRYAVRGAVLTDGPAPLETTSVSLRILARRD